MTDIITQIPITAHHIEMPRQQIRHVGISEAIESLILALVDAYNSIYVTPFTCNQSKPQAQFDEDLDGRDPSW